jgi:hypothetical protein
VADAAVALAEAWLTSFALDIETDSTSLKEHPHKSPHTKATGRYFRLLCGLEVFERFGSLGRIRTYNPSVNSHYTSRFMGFSIFDD